MPGFIEHRRFPRRKFSHTLGVLHRGMYAVENALEISEGGMLLATTRDVKSGDEVVINFFLTSKAFVSVRATVIYRLNPPQPDGGATSSLVGIKFRELAIEMRRLIRDYIAEKTYEEAAEIF